MAVRCRPTELTWLPRAVWSPAPETPAEQCTSECFSCCELCPRAPPGCCLCHPRRATFGTQEVYAIAGHLPRTASRPCGSLVFAGLRSSGKCVDFLHAASVALSACRMTTRRQVC